MTPPNSAELLANPDEFPRPVVAYAFDLTEDGLSEVEHAHKRAQLLYPIRGVVLVEIENSLWVAPPNCAVWIPAGLPHKVRGIGELEISCLFVEPGAAFGMPPSCCIVTVPPVLHEMLLAFIARPPLYPLGDTAANRFVAVLLDELATAGRQPLYVPMPRDPRLRKLSELIVAGPSLRFTIDMWADHLAVSARTLTRLFVKETGLSFGKWRRQLQLSLAVQWLAEGKSVTSIALDLGYENTSAFISMFKQALGRTPARYFQARSKSIENPPKECRRD